MSGITCHGRVGIGVDHVQTGIGADDAVEIAAKLQVAAEQAPMQMQVLWRLVHEVDAVRAPLRAEQCRAQAEQHTDDQFRGLAAGQQRFGDHLGTNDHHPAGFFNEDPQGVIHQMTIVLHYLKGLTQGALLAEQEADRAEV
ncbi:hypothetical protein D3C81_1653980 [compost metagenome]